MKVTSPNFQFLIELDPILAKQAARAERYCLEDPSASLTKVRLLAELIAKNIAAKMGVYSNGMPQAKLIGELKYRGYLNGVFANMFHSIRETGNKAVHEGKGSSDEALRNLRYAHQIAIQYYKVFKDPKFKPEPFKTPPNPVQANDHLKKSLEEARQQIANLQKAIVKKAAQTKEEVEKSKKAEEEAEKKWLELQSALELAQETEEKARQEALEYEKKLEQIQKENQEQSEQQIQTTIQQASEASETVELTEADTRQLIDMQLVDAGWEADSANIRFSKGVRPEKGKNKAIAEWPVEKGYADYVLFVGLKAIAIVEAKKQTKDVSSAIDQAKRYSRDFKTHNACELTDMVEGEYQIPFVFSTNGRPFLRQMETQSGIWFCDLRRSKNLRRPLESWYTPQGVIDLGKMDLDQAEKKLDEMSFSFDFNLRHYQKNAIIAVEKTLKKGKQTALLAMATGTGKTKTCIALIYRLLQAQRFKRILFLVDRSALGEQAANAFKDTEITGLKKFAEIFAIKELKDKAPDRETDVQIATVQGMVQRILYAEDESKKAKVDQYDCIVVDECHRGYLLDKEMSETELSFRSYEDYVSKYRRVLDYFDAVKVGLTATPALHTSDIFGKPVFRYTYREAILDDYLVDHEPPYLIKTELANKGVHWKKDTQLKMFNPDTGKLELHNTPDNLDFDVAAFNKKVITPSFNKVVCNALAEEIDPESEEKTLIFCANDRHADLVVDLMKKAFVNVYGEVDDDAIRKITGASDKPLEQIRRYKNEKLPNVAVTVDLMTTGIDVPAICNLVFIRRVNSRILYEQMLGRATRKCDEIQKEVFRIYDAVDIYTNMQEYSDMKPIVVDPKISYTQLVKEIVTASDEGMKQLAKDQFIAKLQRKKKHLHPIQKMRIKDTTGTDAEGIIQEIAELPIEKVAEWFKQHPNLGETLDKEHSKPKDLIPVSEKQDKVTEIIQGWGDGKAKKPEDYILGFEKFIKENQNKITALKLVLQKPRELTRSQLKELQLKLDEKGYREQDLKLAYKKQTNAEIAAGMIGFIRQAAIGDALIPWENRVDLAITRMLSKDEWTRPQEKWLKKIAAQMKKEFVVDKASMNTAQFKEVGGFNRINKVFNGTLEKVLEDMHQLLWEKEA